MPTARRAVGRPLWSRRCRPDAGDGVADCCGGVTVVAREFRVLLVLARPEGESLQLLVRQDRELEYCHQSHCFVFLRFRPPGWRPCAAGLAEAETAQHPTGQNEVEKPFMACAYEVPRDATAKATKAGITGRNREEKAKSDDNGPLARSWFRLAHGMSKTEERREARLPKRD